MLQFGLLPVTVWLPVTPIHPTASPTLTVTLCGWKEVPTAVTIVVAAPAWPIRPGASEMASSTTAASSGSLSITTLPAASARYTRGRAAGIGYHGSRGARILGRPAPPDR